MMGRFGHPCKPADAISLVGLTPRDLRTSAVMTTFWHPFADMAALESAGELTLARGEGSHVWDTDGTRYLDATAGLWFANVGHGRAEIADAAATQMRRLAAYHTFGDLTSEPTAALTDRVAALAPMPDAKVFLTSGGSDSVDTAMKMVRRFWTLTGQPDRTVLIRREKAYHGMHTAGTSLAGIPANADGYGPLLHEVVEVPWDDADALYATIDQLGEGRVAGFFCEPVMGAGGVFPPPPGYLEKARAICRDLGVLFIADEVITGFGRCGAWFASERFGLEPDLVTCAKGITSGYLPLGAVLAAPTVWEPFWREGAGMFRHGRRAMMRIQGPNGVGTAGQANKARRTNGSTFTLAAGPETRPTTTTTAPLPHVELYTDGACSGNPGPGGWGYILKHPATAKEKKHPAPRPSRPTTAWS